MANAIGFISKTRNDIDAFMRAYQELRADLDKYEKLGGDVILEKYDWATSDFTQEQWKAMIVSLNGIVAYMDKGDGALFYQAGS
jgi:hypothetical protein